MVKAKIINVDMDGFMNREFHPNVSDEGLTVYIAAAETFLFTEELEVIEFEDPRFVSLMLKYPEWVFTCYKCKTEHGRILELMDHEIEMTK